MDLTPYSMSFRSGMKANKFTGGDLKCELTHRSNLIVIRSTFVEKSTIVHCNDIG